CEREPLRRATVPHGMGARTVGSWSCRTCGAGANRWFVWLSHLRRGREPLVRGAVARAARVRTVGSSGCRTCGGGANRWFVGLSHVRRGCEPLVRRAVARAARARTIAGNKAAGARCERLRKKTLTPAEIADNV